MVAKSNIQVTGVQEKEKRMRVIITEVVTVELEIPHRKET
jgi:hypothetical protein